MLDAVDVEDEPKRLVGGLLMTGASCGDHIQTAPPPPRVLGQSKYGAGFVAHLVVSRLLDSIPVYRMEKRFKRMGIPMPRSTMNDPSPCG